MKPRQIRETIAESIWAKLSANEVERFCVRLGLRPADEGEHPFNGKRAYVMRRLDDLKPAQVLDVARAVLEEWDDPDLQEAIGGGGARGVDGSLRDLIFAAKGPKPKIVLSDALNNVVDVVENAQNCLFYDRQLSSEGLSWTDLTAWWKAVLGTSMSDRDVARNLWERLHSSLQSDVERLLFRSYTARYGTEGFHLPALIPQVYLHYDPYSLASGAGGNLMRQRMDFLLLLRDRQRVVIEVDGAHHYADDDTRASPRRYAEMVAEDRKLRLAGYEVYRFGGYELMSGDKARGMLDEFFDKLLGLHGSGES